MADRRIRYDKAREKIMNSVWDNTDSTGPFRTKVDVLCFAAAFGASKDSSAELKTLSEPIRMEIFERHGYAKLFDLLAIHKTKNAEVLAATDEAEDKRAKIFEEYANGGLIILESRAEGSSDLTEEVSLLIGKYRPSEDKHEETLDISSLLDAQ